MDFDFPGHIWPGLGEHQVLAGGYHPLSDFYYWHRNVSVLKYPYPEYSSTWEGKRRHAGALEPHWTRSCSCSCRAGKILSWIIPHISLSMLCYIGNMVCPRKPTNQSNQPIFVIWIFWRPNISLAVCGIIESTICGSIHDRVAWTSLATWLHTFYYTILLSSSLILTILGSC